MGEKITGDNITDEQIRELHWRGAIDFYTRDMAINWYGPPTARETTARWRNDARARCAEILNARAKEAVR